MKKLKRSTVIPLILAIYLAVMAYIGYPEYAAGRTSALYYFGIIGITSIILILLHFNLKKRERLRRERIDDINRAAETEDNDKTNS
ncbi:MAG: hypothetical protein K2F91_01420 [Muribaculaceae bacterium]|nr:hypothetical protein [Muribaculaceae bacterium]MDE6196508.1 hypothetical protein [Muribaculaceae bacterium]